MNDLRDRLGQFIGETQPPTAAQIDADVLRGRKAQQRRRAVQAGAGSVFVVAAVVAAFAFTGTGSSPARPEAGAATQVSVDLVAYKGEQPKGFTIDTVPAGWFIQSDEVVSLTLAPISAKNPGPEVDPSKSPVYDPASFVGKIGIVLESKDQHGPRKGGTAIKAAGQDGTLLKSLRGVTPDGPMPTAAGGDTGWEIWIKQPSGIYLIVQFWQGLGLTQDQMVEIAAGVHVEKAAQQVGG